MAENRISPFRLRNWDSALVIFLGLHSLPVYLRIVVDRFDVNLVLALGFLVWSLATAATGLVHGFLLLLLMRLVLGMGESVTFPCYSKILARHLRTRLRQWSQRGLNLIKAFS